MDCGLPEHSEVLLISASSADSQACGTIENQAEVRALPQAQFELGHDPAKLLKYLSGQVAERLMATDCKSVAPCELRRFESSPVHQIFTHWSFVIGPWHEGPL